MRWTLSIGEEVRLFIPNFGTLDATLSKEQPVLLIGILSTRLSSTYNVIGGEAMTTLTIDSFAVGQLPRSITISVTCFGLESTGDNFLIPIPGKMCMHIYLRM